MAGGVWLTIGHLLHKIQGSFCVYVFVRIQLSSTALFYIQTYGSNVEKTTLIVLSKYMLKTSFKTVASIVVYGWFGSLLCH
jgi:hypothetical protein